MENSRFIDIHLEGVDDKGEKLDMIIKGNYHCAISVVPRGVRNEWYGDSVLGLVRDIVHGNGILGQHGDTHECRYDHRIADPNHENACPYHHVFGSEKKEKDWHEQRQLIKQGRATLFGVFETSPRLYVPPNHLFNGNTLSVAGREGYSFFAERGIVTASPYLAFTDCAMCSMIVVPESKSGRFTYVHYDQISLPELEALLKQASPFSEIKPEEASKSRRKLNQLAVRGLKLGRDCLRAVGLVE